MTPTQKRAAIPPASDLLFRGSIIHPDLWLWDSWTLARGEEIDLFCLALNRRAEDGSPIAPGDRNDYPFHVRHFTSLNSGKSWRDLGAFLQPGGAVDGGDARNVWSGSVAQTRQGDYVFAYTGLREMGLERPFVQTLCAVSTDELAPLETVGEHTLSCPLRDYEAIREAGYYLGPKEMLGDAGGEEGGPILAWRDPFVFMGADGAVRLYWSAKTGPAIPAIASATLSQTNAGWRIAELHPPMLLPDGAHFTQAEVPKLYWDAAQELYFLLVAACDRLHEGQPDETVSKTTRLYKSLSPLGPWVAHHGGESLLPCPPHVFGASVIEADFGAGLMTLLAPYTERAAKPLQLSFAAPFEVSLFGGEQRERGAQT